MADTDATADAALDAVLGATAADDAVTGALVVDGQDVVPETQWLCTPEEAKKLVASASDALVQFDNSIQRIVEVRAWEPLGYSDPRSFVLQEFGPAKDDPDNPHRVSRGHAYRLARVATFAYELAKMFGTDVSYGLDVSEYALRQLPASADLDVIAAVEDRVKNMGDLTPEEVQSVLDDEIAKARTNLASKNTKNATEDESDWGDSAWDYGDEADLQARLDGIDSDAANEALLDPDDLDPDDAPAAQPISVTDLSTFSPDTADGAALDDMGRLRSLLAGLQKVSAIHDSLPELIDLASDDELDQLALAAQITRETCDTLIAAVADL